MLRKLLAAVFAATLMAGAAWGAQVDASSPGTTGGDWTGNADLFTGTGAAGGNIGSSAATANVAQINSTAGVGIGVTAGGTTALGVGVDFTLNVAAGIDTATGALHMGGELKNLNVTGGLSSGAMTVGGALTNLHVGGAVSTAALTIDGVTSLVSFGNTLTTTGNVSIGETTAVKLMEVAGLVDITGTLDIGDTGKTSEVNFKNGLEVSGAVTYTASTVTVTGDAIYADALDVAGGSYTNTGDVSIGEDSDWGIAANASDANATKVEITGVVTVADGKSVLIQGKSTAILGGFEWDATADAATLTVDEASTLTIKNSESDAVVFTSETGGDSHALVFDDGSTVNIEGDLHLTGDGAGAAATTSSLFVTGTTTGNVLNVGGTLLVDDSGTVVNKAGLTTTVTGETTITDTAQYQVGGVNDQYLGGIVVEGGATLTGITGAAAELTTGESAWVTLKDGGKIDATTTGNSFTIKGMGVQVTNNGTTQKGVIDTNTNDTTIEIKGELKVAGNLDLTIDTAAGGITVDSYSQTAGLVDQTDGGQFTVENSAKIEGTLAAPSTFNVIADGSPGNATTFKQGVTIGEHATIKGDGGLGAEVITLGENQTITVDGGTVNNLGIEGTGAKLEIGAKGATLTGVKAAGIALQVNSEFDFANGATTVNAGSEFKNGDINEGVLVLTGDGAGPFVANLTVNDNVKIAKDAIIYVANPGPATIAANILTTDKSFHAQAGSYLVTNNAQLNINGFKTTTIDGNVILGDATGFKAINIDDTAAAAGQKISFGSTANLVLSPTAARNITPGDVSKGEAKGQDVMTSTRNGSLADINSALAQQNNALGQFTFAVNSPAGGGADSIYLAAKDGITDGDYQEADIAEMANNLDIAWAPQGAAGAIDGSIVGNVYDFIYGAGAAGNISGTFQYEDIYSASGNAFGAKNIFRELLMAAAIHDTSRVSEGTFKTVFGNGDVSDMLNAGTGEVQGIQSAIGARNTQLRGQMAAAGDVYYEYANPTLLLNNDYANRIWAGYIGQWEKADTRDNVSGYDYDSHGFIIGYDRLVGCNFAFGGAFAYSRGDYEDKAADTNNSKIDNYSVNAYATYSALNGVFASLFGGYMYQDNDLSATYRTTARKADYDADFWNIGGQLGYDFQPVDGLILTPSIGLQYIHGSAESFTSNLTGPASATYGYGFVSGTSSRSLLLPIELAARYAIDFSDCSRLAIEGNLGYSYNFLDDGGDAGMIAAGVTNAAGAAVGFAGREREQSRHTFNAGAGLRYTVNRFDIGVKYDYYLRQDAHAHRVMGSLGLSF